MIPSEQELRKLLEENGLVKKSGIHLIGTCPSCGSELKFYINIRTGLNDCKKGCKPSNIYGFLKHFDALHLLQGEVINVKADLENKLFKQEQVRSYNVLADSPMPPGYTKLAYDDENVYAEYLRKRKYTQEDFLLYQPGYTDLIARFENYVLIPVYQNWSIKGYLARSILPDVELRYQNKIGVQFAQLLDGIDECTANTETAIILEGHFDKVSVTTELGLHQQETFKAVCTYGKKLTEAQMQLFAATNIKNLIFLYDMGDAITQIKTYGNKLKRQFNVLSCFKRTNKDAGKMQASEILQLLTNAHPIENFTYNYVQFNVLK